MSKKTSQYWKVGEVAKEFRLNENVIYKYIHEGRIKAYRFGGAYRIANDDLEAFIRQSRI